MVDGRFHMVDGVLRPVVRVLRRAQLKQPTQYVGTVYRQWHQWRVGPTHEHVDGSRTILDVYNVHIKPPTRVKPIGIAGALLLKGVSAVEDYVW